MVSVVISTYNAVSFITDTLNSVLNQTYNNLEIIIVDDGSTDGTIGEIEKFITCKKIKLIKSRHTGNIGKNLNDAIRISTGEIIAPLGADDLWVENKIEKQLEYLKDYNIVCSNAKVIDNNGKLIQNVYHDHNDNFEIKLSDLLINNEVIASSVLFYKNIVDECGYFDEEVGNRAEDYSLWLRISEKYNIFYINETLVNYRKHDLNLSFKSFYDREALLLRTIELKKEYLSNNDYQVNHSAMKGISILYTELIKLSYKGKHYNKAYEYCTLYRLFDRSKLNKRKFKYTLLYFYLGILRMFIKKYPNMSSS